MKVRAVMTSLALIFCGNAGVAQDAYVLAADGYYYAGGRAYTRTWYAGTSYCGRNNCYYTTPGYYAYTAVVQPVAVTTSNVTNNYPPANWRTEIIQAHEKKAEIAAYEAALATLTGYSGFNYPGYGNTLQLSTQGVQGSTVYGTQLRDFYGDNNLSLLSQGLNRFLDNGQNLMHDAFGQTVSVVDAHDERAQRTAEIIAKGQVLTALLGPPPSATKSTLTVTPTPLPQQQQEQAPQQPTVTVKPLDSTAAWVTSAQRCIACHGNGKKEGGFEISSYPSMTPEQRLNVIGRLTTKDDKLRMPRNADKSPGPRLGAAEIRAWLNVGSS